MTSVPSFPGLTTWQEYVPCSSSGNSEIVSGDMEVRVNRMTGGVGRGLIERRAEVSETGVAGGRVEEVSLGARGDHGIRHTALFLGQI